MIVKFSSFKLDIINIKFITEVISYETVLFERNEGLKLDTTILLTTSI